MGKLITTLQHPDPLINRIQDGIAQVCNPLLKAWYDKFGIPGDCAAKIIQKTVTLADDWITPTLYNSWIHYGAPYAIPAYRKRNGYIEINGALKNGTIGTSCYRLPSGYYAKEQFWDACVTSSAVGRVSVDGPSGNQGYVTPQSPSVNTYVEFHLVVPALDPTPVPNSIFPVTFAHGLTPGKAVSTVLLADAVDTTSLAHVSSSCSWEPYGPEQIRIVDLPGLCALRTYDLTFLVLGG